MAEWYGGSRDPLNATEASKTVNIARLFGALVNTVIGGDAQVGADAAGNAAQNNFLNHAQVKQLNAQLAQCQGQASCISQTIDDARALDRRQHDLIGQTETIQGSRALVEGIQRPGAPIDTSLCSGVAACVQYAAELPLINSRDYIYGTQDRLGELAQITRIHAFETQIRQANPELSEEEVTRQAGARAGVYDAGRLGLLLGAESRGRALVVAMLRRAWRRGKEGYMGLRLISRLVHLERLFLQLGIDIFRLRPHVFKILFLPERSLKIVEVLTFRLIILNLRLPADCRSRMML